MKLFITGGTGFVGRNLIPALLEKGHSVATVGSSPTPHPTLDKRVTYLAADTTRGGTWQEQVGQADGVINLAGRSIFHLWTDSYRRQIYDSRILTTRNLVEALPKNRPTIMVSASAAGYYGDCRDEPLTEGHAPGSDFLATVCRDWEKEAQLASRKGARVIITRFGVIAGDNGGAIGKMILPYRFMFGGPLGSGLQWFPWIHIDDLVAALTHLIENPKAQAAYNLTSPQPIQNLELSRVIGRVLRRPAFFRVPAWTIRLVLGEFGSMLLFSQRAIPKRLNDEGFRFRFPDFEEALREVLKR